MRSSGVNCSKWEDDAVVVSPLSICVLLLPPIRSPKCVDILGVAVVGLTGTFVTSWVRELARIVQSKDETRDEQSSEIESL